MDDAYSPVGVSEALYAELDRESVRSANPSYQNTAYSQCGEVSSTYREVEVGTFLTALYSTEIQFPGARAGHSHGGLVGAEQRLLLGLVGDGNAWRREWQQSGRLRDSWT